MEIGLFEEQVAELKRRLDRRRTDLPAVDTLGRFSGSQVPPNLRFNEQLEAAAAQLRDDVQAVYVELADLQEQIALAARDLAEADSSAEVAMDLLDALVVEASANAVDAGPAQARADRTSVSSSSDSPAIKNDFS